MPSHNFVVYAIGQVAVDLVGIRALDMFTGTWYEVYPEGRPAYCHPGSYLVIAYGGKNIGTVAGTVYGRILGPSGEVLHQGSQWCGVGNMVYWEPTLNMPAHDIRLTVEIASTPDFSTASRAEFTLSPVGAPPEEGITLSMIAAAALAIVDVALIMYYIVPKKLKP
jgi:hypothetical protein